MLSRSEFLVILPHLLWKRMGEITVVIEFCLFCVMEECGKCIAA